MLIQIFNHRGNVVKMTAAARIVNKTNQHVYSKLIFGKIYL